MHAIRGIGLAGLAGMMTLLFGFARPALAVVANNLVIIEDDGYILEPPEPLPFSGRRIILDPVGAGYVTRVEPGVVPASLGARLDLSRSEHAYVHVPLARPIPLYGRFYRDLYVHEHGAISFGEPFPAGAGAWSTDPAERLSGLSDRVPVLAVLWNELLPPENATADGGIYLAELPDRVVVTWANVPSIRPAGTGNTFRAIVHTNGRIELEYPRLATQWGIVGLSPGGSRRGTDMTNLATEPEVLPGRALFSWYRDRPRLNEVALARRVYAEAPDRFDFLAVFTDRVVESSHLVGSVTVSNDVHGIGMPIFNHARVFGSQHLEHIVLMNSLSFYDENPAKPPQIPSYAYAPSTLAVLGHELGHRWLAHAGEPLVAPGRRGHWNYFLETDGSFMGGSRLQDNADGTFTTGEVMARFGALDQYLMGVRAPAEVDDFFVVEEPFGHDVDPDAPPAAGTTFGGERRDLSVDDVIAQLGERRPQEDGVKVFRMGFVLVVPRGAVPADADLAKLQRIRRTFGPYFRAATDGRARVRTWLPAAEARADAPASYPALPRNPFILGVGFRAGDDGVPVASVDFLDITGDLVELELTTDVSANHPPARIDVASAAFGNRRGTVAFPLHHIPAGASELHFALVDSSGLRSEVFAVPLQASPAAT